MLHYQVHAVYPVSKIMICQYNVLWMILKWGLSYLVNQQLDPLIP